MPAASILVSAGRPRPVERQARLADIDPEDLPGIRVIARLEVAVRDEQCVAHEGESPGGMEPRIGDPSDLVAGRIQHGDLVRAEQAHVEVARLREGETGRLWRRL